jgi:hypothetical protein
MGMEEEPGSISITVLQAAGDEALEHQKASSVSDVTNISGGSDGTRTRGLLRDW